MALAYQAFIGCRVGDGALLAALARVLDEVARQGSLFVEIPDSELPSEVAEWFDEGGQSVRPPKPLDLVDMSEEDRRHFSLVQIATTELARLWRDGHVEPMRSLGYAMHNIPGLVGTAKEFDREGFGFSFAVAAFHWSAYSPAMKNALAETVGVSLEEAGRWARREGFAVDMYRSMPADSIAWNDVHITTNSKIVEAQPQPQRKLTPLEWIRRRFGFRR